MITPDAGLPDGQLPQADCPGGSTRERLLAAGLRLFAERGFDAVSVGDIEKEVGLAPRRGALYRHFSSKEELLTIAAEEHMAGLDSARQGFVSSALAADMDPERLGHLILEELDRRRALTHILERDGERLKDLRARYREYVAENNYRTFGRILATWVEKDAENSDPEARTVLLLGALVNARRSAWTFGQAPCGVDDDRLVREWAKECLSAPREETHKARTRT